jgi:hypothetical protein
MGPACAAHQAHANQHGRCLTFSGHGKQRTNQLLYARRSLMTVG